MKYLYVANWKMNMSFEKSITFCAQNYNRLISLSATADIVICPSFIALKSIIEIFKNSIIAIGAQNCSQYAIGPYTGEIAAQSLKEIGVAYCIVGHSERRIHYGETSEVIAKKVVLLCENNIQPIICIGETEMECNQQKIFTVLTQQIEQCIKIIHNMPCCANRVIIAYEPVWSIGTGIILKQEQLEKIFTWLAELLYAQLPNYSIQLLYGGSVSSINVSQLKTIRQIDGFLVGGASLNFESFSKIITQ